MVFNRRVSWKRSFTAATPVLLVNNASFSKGFRQKRFCMVVKKNKSCLCGFEQPLRTEGGCESGTQHYLRQVTIERLCTTFCIPCQDSTLIARQLENRDTMICHNPHFSFGDSFGLRWRFVEKKRQVATFQISALFFSLCLPLPFSNLPVNYSSWWLKGEHCTIWRFLAQIVTSSGYILDHSALLPPLTPAPSASQASKLQW